MTTPAATLARARWDKPENVDRRINALAERVAQVVATLPPLTEAQKQQLRAVIAPALSPTDRREK